MEYIKFAEPIVTISIKDYQMLKQKSEAFDKVAIGGHWFHFYTESGLREYGTITKDEYVLAIKNERDRILRELEDLKRKLAKPWYKRLFN